MRWQLPPGRGFAILHADLIAAGEDVVWADRESDPKVQAFRKFRDAVRAKQHTPRPIPPASSI